MSSQVLTFSQIHRFYEDFNFPGVVGCVDGTHVPIFTPKIIDEDNPEHIYVNRKGYHSINVQLVSISDIPNMNSSEI